MLAEHEMFEKFGGGETSKQGQAAETISCQANNVGQFRQAFIVIFIVLMCVELFLCLAVTLS